MELCYYVREVAYRWKVIRTIGDRRACEVGDFRNKRDAQREASRRESYTTSGSLRDFVIDSQLKGIGDHRTWETTLILEFDDGTLIEEPFRCRSQALEFVRVLRERN